MGDHPLRSIGEEDKVKNSGRGTGKRDNIWNINQ